MNKNSPPPPAPLKTERVSLRRRPDRGQYSLEAVTAILDQTFLCHLGFVAAGQPFVIPTSFGLEGGKIYVHGSSASRMLRELSQGIPMCFTAMILDGLVLARSAFNHSMNYRSVVVLGKAFPVEGAEKLKALEIMSEHMVPGRWAETRLPNSTEMMATSVLSIDIAEASTKIRSGPPLDDDEDMDHQCWAGVLPVQAFSGLPIPDPRSKGSPPAPSYLGSVRGLTTPTDIEPK
jgi:nitroimidazol reductase NimA-like FMN-containing flavoprotein (pyridoxamine 5'-phosphate oxidase superfamily)